MTNGTSVGNLNVKMGLDDSGFKQGVKNTETSTNKLGGKLKSSFGKIGGFIGKAVLAGTAIAGAAIIGFGAKAISIASDLEEVQNVVDTVFEGSADVIEDFSKTAGTQFGLSELAAKQYAGTMGALLTPSGLGEEAITDMSTNLVGLSGDMASFFNIADEDAFNKLRAGISGETEPLKQLGINMSVANLEAFALSKGIDESFNSLTQAEQATLRYQFIMDATSKVQGDFAKTSDSLANQQRIGALNAENLANIFGKKLLPVAGTTMKGINTLISGLMPQFEGLAEGLGGLLSGQEGAAEQFKSSAKDIVSGLADGLKTALPVIVEVITSLIEVVLDTILTFLPVIIESGIQIILALIEGIIKIIPTLIETAVEIIISLVDGLLLALPLLIEAAITLITALIDGIITLIPVLINTAIEIVLTLIKGLIQALPLLVEAAISLVTALVEGIIGAIPLLIEAIPALIMALLNALINLLPVIVEGAVNIVVALVQGIAQAIPLLVEAIPSLIEAIVNTLIDLLPLIVDSALLIVMTLLDTIINNAPLLLEAVLKIADVLIEGIIDLVPALWEAGKDLIIGLVEGIKSFDLGGFIKGLGETIVGGIKDFFDISSPSGLMKREVGKPIAQGIVPEKTAMDKAMAGISGVVNSFANNIAPPNMAVAGSSGQGDFTFIIENVNLASGSREEAIRAGKIIGNTAVRLARQRGQM